MNLKVETIKPRSRSEIGNERLCGFLEVSIEVIDGLHIGTGRLSFKAEKKVLDEFLSKFDINYEKLGELENKIFFDFAEFSSYHDGRVIIPASSVKGNVRSRLELSFREKGNTVKSCLAQACSEGRSWRHQKIWETWGDRRNTQCGFEKKKPERVCILCDLFGTMGLAGVVRFSDFIGDKNVKIENKSFEYNVKLCVAAPGSLFRGKISFFNLERHEIGLLLLGMGIENGAVGRPVLMGRLKYRGKIGKIRYRLEALELSRLSFPLVVEGLNIQPGQKVSQNVIDKLVKALVDEAKLRFKDELQIVDEVKRLEEVLRSGRTR